MAIPSPVPGRANVRRRSGETERRRERPAGPDRTRPGKRASPPDPHSRTKGPGNGTIQDPADDDRGFPRVIPHGGVRGDLHCTWSYAIPLRNEHRSPLGLLIRQHRFQRRPVIAFEPGFADGTRFAVGRRIIEGRVKTQPRDHTGARPCFDLSSSSRPQNYGVIQAKDDHTRRDEHRHSGTQK